MAGNFMRTLFGDAARALQTVDGSRASYARMEAAGDGPDQLGEAEAAFIAARDSFYFASITAEGWPYVQHRGGPAGFLRVIEGNRIGFADFRGNRQHISTANLASSSKVSLLLIDYAAKQRLKLIGTCTVLPRAEDPVLVEGLRMPGYPAVIERAYLIDVVGFDWNCPQHITPRFTEAEIKAGIAPLMTELNALRAELAQLKAAQ